MVIGAGDNLQRSASDAAVAAEFPLLAKAASWIGSIANQSRATLGGNLVNGSPAADSSPALLVYDAEIELVSVRGKRRIPYREFQPVTSGTCMTADELLYAVHLPRRFAQHRQYLRKVGTRRAMAISKVALAATALIKGDVIAEIRLAAASLAPFPRASIKTEAALFGQTLTPNLIEAARAGAARRSAAHRRHPFQRRNIGRCVGANLLEEFLRSLQSGGRSAMNAVLAAWNNADESSGDRSDAGLLRRAALGCSDGCAAPHPKHRRIERSSRPRLGTMEGADWLEAFACHPRIGERKAAHALSKSTAWSTQEQAGTSSAAKHVLRELAEGNAHYESASASPTSCAQPARAPKRCWPSSSAASPTIARQNCAKLPSSSGRSCRSVSESGCVMSKITTHVLDTVLGKPGAPVQSQCWLERLETRACATKTLDGSR